MCQIPADILEKTVSRKISEEGGFKECKYTSSCFAAGTVAANESTRLWLDIKLTFTVPKLQYVNRQKVVSTETAVCKFNVDAGTLEHKKNSSSAMMSPAPLRKLAWMAVLNQYTYKDNSVCYCPDMINRPNNVNCIQDESCDIVKYWMKYDKYTNIIVFLYHCVCIEKLPTDVDIERERGYDDGSFEFAEYFREYCEREPTSDYYTAYEVTTPSKFLHYNNKLHITGSHVVHIHCSDVELSEVEQ